MKRYFKSRCLSLTITKKDGGRIKFRNGLYETADPKEIELLLSDYECTEIIPPHSEVAEEDKEEEVGTRKDKEKEVGKKEEVKGRYFGRGKSRGTN